MSLTLVEYVKSKQFGNLRWTIGLKPPYNSTVNSKGAAGNNHPRGAFFRFYGAFPAVKC